MFASPGIALRGVARTISTATAPEGGTTFPILRRRGPLALISVSSARPDAAADGDGTAGTAASLQALERMLAGLSAEQAFRVLLIHHPLRSNARTKRLTDSAALLALLKQHGVEMILHGHDHVHSTIWVEGPNGPIPAIGVPSASAIAHGRHPAAAYNLFAIEREGAGWRVEQRIRGIDDLLARSRVAANALS